MDREAIRKERQEKADNKAARVREWAKKAEEKSQSLRASIPSDMQFWTQPSLGRHEKFRDRLRDRLDRSIRLGIHAQKLRERADSIQENVSVSGDAERIRQAKRDLADTLIHVNSTVYDPCFGTGEVVRVNKKTFSIRFSSGPTYARDKAFVRPV